MFNSRKAVSTLFTRTILRRAVGETPANVANCPNTLGRASEGDYGAMRDDFEQALAIRRQALGLPMLARSSTV